MKKIKDTFHYFDQGGIGLSCIDCKFCNKKNIPEDWPTDDLKCSYHNMSLNLELKEKGNKKSYINGEYFCKQFENTRAIQITVQEFDRLKNELEENILYEACHTEYLCMTPFEEIEKV